MKIYLSPAVFLGLGYLVMARREPAPTHGVRCAVSPAYQKKKKKKEKVRREHLYIAHSSGYCRFSTLPPHHIGSLLRHFLLWPFFFSFFISFLLPRCLCLCTFATVALHDPSIIGDSSSFIQPFLWRSSSFSSSTSHILSHAPSLTRAIHAQKKKGHLSRLFGFEMEENRTREMDSLADYIIICTQTQWLLVPG